LPSPLRTPACVPRSCVAPAPASATTARVAPAVTQSRPTCPERGSEGRDAYTRTGSPT